jgi:hypothetical protein
MGESDLVSSITSEATEGSDDIQVRRVNRHTIGSRAHRSLIQLSNTKTAPPLESVLKAFLTRSRDDSADNRASNTDDDVSRHNIDSEIIKSFEMNGKRKDAGSTSVTASFPTRISLATMHMVFFAGLRGAVSYSCAQIFPNTNGNRNLVVHLTTAVILVTILLQATFTASLVGLLGIPVNVNTQHRLTAKRNKRKPSASCRFFVWLDRMERRYLYPHVLRRIAREGEVTGSGLKETENRETYPDDDDDDDKDDDDDDGNDEDLHNDFDLSSDGGSLQSFENLPRTSSYARFA